MGVVCNILIVCSHLISAAFVILVSSCCDKDDMYEIFTMAACRIKKITGTDFMIL